MKLLEYFCTLDIIASEVGKFGKTLLKFFDDFVDFFSAISGVKKLEHFCVKITQPLIMTVTAKIKVLRVSIVSSELSQIDF